MKRRVLCAVLAILMLLSLFTGVLMQAAAAEMTSSEEAIAILKELEGFVEKPYYDNGQYSVGYGSGCNKNDYPNGITEEEADKLLREYLKDMEKNLNYFISRYGLSLKQNQYDALMLFTYNVGANWLNADGELRNAVINGLTGNNFIYPMTLWSNASSKVNMHLVKRRLAEASMYLNGNYSATPPKNYSYVLYDHNGGISNVKVQGYDASQVVIPKAAPVLTGYRFMGWYTAAEGGRWVTELNESTKEMTLHAHWQEGAGDAVNGTAVSYSKSTRNISSLDVYEVPGSSQLIAKLTSGETVNIVADYVDAAGIKWGKLESGGWVNLGNAIVGVYTVQNEQEPVTVTVTADNVNFRTGAGTHTEKAGKLSKGDKIEILETKMVGTNKWGRFSDGWINLMYTTYDSDLKDQIEDSATVIATGTVVNCTSLRIRSGPGTNYPVLGGLNSGTKVQILQQKAVNGVAWGKISSGWICLTYVSTKAVDADKEDSAENAADVICTVTVTNGNVNVRSGPGTTNAKVSAVYYNQKLNLTEVVKSGGVYWGKFSAGWVCLTYTNYHEVMKDSGVEEKPEQEESKPETDTTTVTGTINSTAALRIRKGPGTQYDRIGCYTNGNRVTIYETQTVNNQKWGRTDLGWICLDYVKLDSKLPEAETKPEETKPEETKPEETKPEETKPQETEPEEETKPEADSDAVTGTINSTAPLRIRKGPGTKYDRIGCYTNGNRVTIYEIQTVDKQQWGRTDQGWICLDYVKLDSELPETETKPEETKPEQDTTTPDTETEGVEVEMTGVVSCEGTLNIRSGAGTGYPKVGTYSKGDKISVVEQKNVNGQPWGRTDQGWICLSYVQVESGSVCETFTGIVNADGLRIRKSAGNGTVVAYYAKGNRVEILETTMVDGVKWGRTVHGWISLEFVDKK